MLEEQIMPAKQLATPRKAASGQTDAVVTGVPMVAVELPAGPDNGHEYQPDAQATARTSRDGVRTLLVDDHAIFLAGMRSFLEAHPGITVVGHARDGAEAVELACELEPDVILMDVTMPGLNGIVATRQIRTRVVGARILVVSMHAESRVVRRMFSEGAAGYLLKGSAPGDLIRGINALAEDETYLCPKAASLLMGDSGNGRNDDERRASFETLTPREREVLQLIADGNSSKEIAGALHLSIKTVETHRARLMRKLDLHSVAALTKCALREGITTLSD
jgi:DNA-binding NarL/FixJ family response regulator